MPKVLNQKTDKIPPDAIYVGRPSKWGNPFHLKFKGMRARQKSVDLFREYAERKLRQEPEWLLPLRGKDLVCWCSPLPCHVDVLLALANQPK